MPDTTAPRPWTPGPWEAVGHLDVYGIYGKSPWAVAYVNYYAVNEHGWKPSSQAKHDAHLIASAPELYEALERLVLEADETFYGATTQALTQAVDALAKARGEGE